MQKKTIDIVVGKGFGFKDENGFIFLKRCFQCGLENWAVSVASGKCAWCGFDANDDGDDPPPAPKAA